MSWQLSWHAHYLRVRMIVYVRLVWVSDGDIDIDNHPSKNILSILSFASDMWNFCRAKQCPEDAVKIINLPAGLDTNVTHHYGLNAFKLHGLPTPRPGTVLGLLGANGIGKSTALNILSGYFPELCYACTTTRTIEMCSSLPTLTYLVAR